jgi:long-chain acyl-CoA synthetase
MIGHKWRVSSSTPALNPATRVGIMLPNSLATAVVYYGILYAGGVVVPMNPLQSDREVTFF